eukprot:GSChrysophyteH1.ASY1.ANO1.1507.1 assembled CDS
MGAASSLISQFDGENSRKLSFRSALQDLFTIRKQELSAVDKELQRMQEQEKYKHKILLLGAGEAGKSTVLKQIKLLSKVPFTERELEEYTVNIRRNVIEAIQTLLLLFDAQLTPELASTIAMLWADKGVQRVYEQREYYHLMDGTSYYLDEVKRLADPDFVPTEEDTIMTRVRTTGMVTIDITEGLYTYQMVDVGGQRSERRKWIHCFDNVRSIIFLEGLSGYNQVLFEDATTNRMQESMRLFMEVVKNPVFKTTPIFIFLNKKDLFEEMIVKHPLSKCFPDYDGPVGEALPAVKYIEKTYRDIYESFHDAATVKKGRYKPGGVYVQVIAARLRMDMKVAFGEVKETLKVLFPVK